MGFIADRVRYQVTCQVKNMLEAIGFEDKQANGCSIQEGVWEKDAGDCTSGGRRRERLTIEVDLMYMTVSWAKDTIKNDGMFTGLTYKGTLPIPSDALRTVYTFMEWMDSIIGDF